MEEEQPKKSLKEKLKFYVTAFFILLGTFSLFSFLFLVPFIIEPAYTTIKMDFDCNPVLCTTIHTEYKQGVANCSWSSCREGCTKDMYECTQITVTYRNYSKRRRHFYKRGLRDYQDYNYDHDDENDDNDNDDGNDQYDQNSPFNNTSLPFRKKSYKIVEARLFPNVKGCGYPPSLNCTIFFRNYTNIGTKFTCFYSRIDPNFVMTEFNIKQVYLNLIYAVFIPIPSFIFSVIYLIYAYFNIYHLDKDPRLLLHEHQNEDDDIKKNTSDSINNFSAKFAGLSPGSETFRENLLSFGQQLQLSMADDQNFSKENDDSTCIVRSLTSMEFENNEKQYIKATNVPNSKSPVENV